MKYLVKATYKGQSVFLGHDSECYEIPNRMPPTADINRAKEFPSYPEARHHASLFDRMLNGHNPFSSCIFIADVIEITVFLIPIPIEQFAAA